MRRAGLLGVFALAGCIPSVDAPPEDATAPPAASPRSERMPGGDWQPARDDGIRPDPGYEDAPRRGEPQADYPRYNAPRPDSPRDDLPRDREPQEPVAAQPAPPPAWEARPVTADAVTVDAQDYVVQSGDTLSRIADRTGAASDAIARANALTLPFAVRAGQRLTIPGGRYHRVRPGESGIAIARAYGVPWSRIVTDNALAEPYVLRAGQRILIPGAPATALSRASERAAAFTLDVDSILTGGEPALARNAEPARPAATPARVPPATVAVAPPARLAGGGFAWPVDGNVVRRFGPGASGERNDGIKIAVPLATPIRAAADGVVAYAGDGIAALGGLVMVKHGGGWTSIYGHASKLLVQRGQSVKRGQVVALSGETGFADRPEVHFELRRGRTPVDPQGQLPRG